MLRSRTLWLLTLFAAGCATAEAQPTSAACGAVQQRFRDALARASGACHRATDCGCYNPVTPESGCGGVTDRRTVERLQALEQEFHAASCRWPRQCGPWACAPRCEHGRCVQ